MFLSFNSLSTHQSQSAFTLIELLVVIALLSTLVGALVVSYDGIDDQARYDTAKVEMIELRKALLRFRRDSGSHALPNQGVYDCDSSSLIDIAKANDPAGADTWPTGAPSADSDATAWSAWCKHPANFWMLFIDPLAKGWNQDTHRGWNGPYLQRKSGYLDSDADYKTDGQITTPDSNNLIAHLWGISSPFLSKPLANNGLTWRSSIGGEAYSNSGTPYFIFDLDDDSQARLVNMANDNVYNEIDSPNCEQQFDNEDNPKDIILCLLR